MSKKMIRGEVNISPQDLLDFARSKCTAKEWREFARSHGAKEVLIDSDSDEESATVEIEQDQLFGRDALAVMILGEIWRSGDKLSSSELDGDADFAYQAADALLEARQF